MKLYFYLLDTPYFGTPTFRCEECEVQDYPKTYRPVKKFPEGYYGCHVKKSELGMVTGLGKDCLVLLNKDDAVAKQKFKAVYEKLIAENQRRIDEYKSYITAVLSFGGEDNV